jgi:hypothetical protein
MKSISSKLFSKKNTLPDSNIKGNSTDAPDNELKQAGNVRVDGLFWDCLTNHADKKIDVLKKEKMGSVVIHVLPEDDNAEVKWKAVKGITSDLLGEYLKKNELSQFIPMRQPTFVWVEKVLEVCYYHDKELHDIKFGEIRQSGYIMQPNDPFLLDRLQTLCRYYNLQPSDYI